jgi:hypothetical protein
VLTLIRGHAISATPLTSMKLSPACRKRARHCFSLSVGQDQVSRPTGSRIKDENLQSDSVVIRQHVVAATPDDQLTDGLGLGRHPRQVQAQLGRHHFQGMSRLS